MFKWDLILPANLYLDASNFVTKYYITQIQNGKMIILIYNSFILLPANQNYNIYKYNLAVIVKFIKKCLI